jgi:predicted TIM-barrel fold metal-dependent hydrolase
MNLAPGTDIHIHIAARERPDCKVSNQMLAMPAFAYMITANGINPVELTQHFDKTIAAHILGKLSGAPTVERGVLLAIDWVFQSDGTRDDAASHFVVSNDYVRELAKQNPKILFGASINPNRGERAGMQELERCLDKTSGLTAVLVKWVPNAQVIDPNPTDHRHDWFYKALATHNLPLLCHTGPEWAIPVPKGDQVLGDPRLLQRALDLGVKVIAAHAATRFFPTDKYDYVDQLAEMMKRSPNLYADLSAMCVWCREIDTIKRVKDLIPSDRMILGSDYPIPVNDMLLSFMKGIPFEDALKIGTTKNPLERNYRQLIAMGFPQSIGTKAAQVLRASTG